MIIELKLSLCVQIIVLFFSLALLLCSKRKPILVMIAIEGMFLITNTILGLFSKQINPIIRDIFLIVIFAITVIIWLLSLSGIKKIVFFSILLSLICVIGLIIMPGIKTVEYNNIAYIGLYDKMTSIGETWIYCYKADSMFIIDKDYSSIENYGIVLSHHTDLKNREPYEIYYYENGEKIKTEQNYFK